MENITLQQLATGGALILGLWAFVKWIITPFLNYNLRQKEIDERFKENEKHIDNDNKRLNTLENDTKQIMLSLNVLVQHSIDNDHTDQLKQRKSEMDEYLINR